MGTDNPFKWLKTTGKIGKPEDIANAKSHGWSPNTNEAPDVFLKKKSQESMSAANQKTYLGRSSLLGG